MSAIKTNSERLRATIEMMRADLRDKNFTSLAIWANDAQHLAKRLAEGHEDEREYKEVAP